MVAVKRSAPAGPAGLLSRQRYARPSRKAVLTSNYAGQSSGRESAGRSAIWDEQGDFVVQMDPDCRVPGGAPRHRMLARRGHYTPIVLGYT